jgi:hypothetical protein
MTQIWATVLLLAAVSAEVAAGTAGLTLPVVATTVFYLFATHGPRRMLPVAILCCAGLDALYARPGLPSVAGLAIIVFISRQWREHGDSAQRLALCLPGLLVGAATCAVGVLFVQGLRPWQGSGALFSTLLPIALATFAGALILPAMSIAFDWVALRADLPRLAEVRPKKKANAYNYPWT